MYFTFAIFQINEEFTLINGVVNYKPKFVFSGNAKELIDTLDEYKNTSDIIDKGTNEDKTCTYTFAYDQTTDNNLRYVGKTPCNYVSFNGELWRIVGVMNNMYTSESNYTNKTNKNVLFKLIRNESLGKYSWDNSPSDVNGESGTYGRGVNQWGASGSYEGADLMRELNTDYLGNITVGTDGKWFVKNGKDVKPTSTISSSSQNLIENVIWYTGVANNNYISNKAFSALNSYTSERSNNSNAVNNGKYCYDDSSNTIHYCNDTVVRTSIWSGKVGLINLSDYGFASGNTCANISLRSYNLDCYKYNWLIKNTGDEWTINAFADSTNAAGVFHFSPSGNNGSNLSRESQFVSPSVYLKATIKITGGDGSAQTPYTLG